MKKYIITFMSGALVLALFLFAVQVWWKPTAEKKFGTDRAAVIREIQALQNLETVRFSVDKVVEAGSQYSRLKQFLFGDKLLLVAHGDVVAGVNLGDIREQDIQGSGTSVTLVLPPPRILYTKIDNEQTRVFDRDQGIFTKGDINLEAEARQAAEASITAAACSGGILTAANENAQKQIGVLLKAAGFVAINVQTTTPARCP